MASPIRVVAREESPSRKNTPSSDWFPAYNGEAVRVLPPDRPPKNSTVSENSRIAPMAVKTREADQRGDRDPALADQEREDHEQHRGELDRRGQPDQRTLGDPAPLPRHVRQQVGDHQRHQHGVDLTVAEGRAQRLDRQHHRDPDQPELPAAGNPAALQHRLLGPDQAGGPDHLPEHVRAESERSHQDRGDRRIDEVQVPERRGGGKNVPAREHVLHGGDVHLQVDGRRLPGQELAVLDDERQQHQRDHERRKELDRRPAELAAAGHAGVGAQAHAPAWICR